MLSHPFRFAKAQVGAMVHSLLQRATIQVTGSAFIIIPSENDDEEDIFSIKLYYQKKKELISSHALFFIVNKGSSKYKN